LFSYFHLIFTLFSPYHTSLAQNTIACGSAIEGQITTNAEVHKYLIKLSKGDNLIVNTKVPSGYSDLAFYQSIFALNGFVIDSLGSRQTSYSFMSDPVTESGTYTIRVDGSTNTGGKYTISIGCTLPDKTVIKPGDAPPQNLTTSPIEVATTDPSSIPVSCSGSPTMMYPINRTVK
jgi:hypothetical protein